MSVTAEAQPLTSTEKKLEKKKKILETAYNLFKTNSVGATAVDDVVKAAGIARGTFYLYFKDKSDLLEQIILFKSTESMKQLITATKIEIDEKQLDIFAASRLFIDMYIDFLLEHKDVLAVVTKNISSCLRMYPSFYDKEAEELFGYIVGKFTDEGFSIEKVHKLIYIVADMVGSVCSDAILHNKPFTLDEIRPTVTEAAMSIIRNETAKKGEAAI